MPANTQPPLPETGYTNPRCYANCFNDCSRKTSREHIVSQVVLEDMGKRLNIKTRGLHLLGLSPAKTLRSKILCERHNHALSPLDVAGYNFIRALREMHPGAQYGISGVTTVDGLDFERWMLKVLAGSHAANGGRVPSQWVRWLFGYEAISPPNGMYMISHVGDTFSLNDEQIQFSYPHDDEGRTLGVRADLYGYIFYLTVSGRPNRPHDVSGSPIYRPGLLEEVIAAWRPRDVGAKRRVRIAWPPEAVLDRRGVWAASG